MGKFITEFIGSFFLVLVVALTGQPFIIGAVLMVMVFAGGHISGAHYNPAVTLAVWMRGKIIGRDAIIYVIVQLAAASAAALLALWYLGDVPPVPMELDDKLAKALVSEFVGTFALAYVVLNVATSKGTTGNSFYGLAIGFTVFAMASSVGRVSGGAFNPAVALGATILKSFAWKNIWVYLVACFGGAALAAIVYRIINAEDRPMPPLPVA